MKRGLTLGPQRRGAQALFTAAEAGWAQRTQTSGAVPPSHEGVLRWRPVGEAREGSGRLPDAAGHRQRLGAEGGGDGQVGELGVKVSQVRGARLWMGRTAGSLHRSRLRGTQRRRRLTTAGANGGGILLAIRSSQLMGEKKEWNLSSSCRAENSPGQPPPGLRPCSGMWEHTHKVVPDAQPPGAVLLQEPLQQLPAGVGDVGLQHRRLVQDVVVHLSRVATVERRL